MLKFYFAPNTVAIASQIALEEVGAKYEACRLDFSKGEQRGADYLAINPKGRVPALITPKGVVTETIAILELIGDVHPETGLKPTDPFELAHMREVCAYLATTMHVAHAHKLRQARWSDDESSYAAMAAKVPQNMAECCAYIEETALTGPWVLPQYSLADPYLFAVCTWLKGDQVDIADYPRLANHHAAMNERPAVQRAMEHHQ